MILVHRKDGTSVKLDPLVDSDLRYLDDPAVQLTVSRISILAKDGNRIDMPAKNGFDRIWVERVFDREQNTKGERVCMRIFGKILKATLYYSDKRVVLEVD